MLEAWLYFAPLGCQARVLAFDGKSLSHEDRGDLCDAKRKGGRMRRGFFRAFAFKMDEHGDKTS